MKLHVPLVGLGLFFLGVQLASADSITSGIIKQNAYQTDHYQIEFSDLVREQKDENDNGVPDIVDIVAEAAEYSRGVIMDDLGYPDPMAGYSRRLLILLDDDDEYLAEGALGVTSLLSNGDPFVAIDPWLSDSYLQVTVGHELFHTVQFGYDDGFAYSGQGVNWAESTATWIEDQEYDDNNDYTNYLSDFFDYVDFSVFASQIPSSTLFEYALSIWPTFLSEYYAPSFIQGVWENYFDSSMDYEDDRKLYDAVKDQVESEGDDLRTVFRDFTLWNLDLSQYSEGDDYPLVFTMNGVTDSKYQVINSSYAPALFGTNYIYFDNSDEDASFYFHVLKPDGIAFAVTLVPYDNGRADLSKKQSVILDQHEEMADVLELDGLRNADGVYAVVSPLDMAFEGDHSSDFDQGYLYDFFATYGQAGQSFEPLQTSAVDSRPASTGDQKEGEEASLSDGNVKVNQDLNLTVKIYDEDSVSFSWNRVAEAQGYEIHYGTSSGSYSHTESVSRGFTTATTVGGLTEGRKYYFELVAVDAEGNELTDPSNEVSVTPTAWLFTDVSYLDHHYDAIAALTDQGVFEGYSNGSFKPNDTINRAELLKIFVEGRDLDLSTGSYRNCFTDVRDEWYAKYVCYAKAQGWVQGYSDGSFRPGNAVNRVEALKILFQVYEAGVSDGASVHLLSYTDLDQNAWYAQYVFKASELGILEETAGGLFQAGNSRTRAEMAEELYRYLSLGKAQ